MSSDLFTPNEVVGYRFRADWHNITVVVVKRYGPNSKKAGQEYDTPLAYCRDIPNAAAWLTTHLTREKGAAAQASEEAISGSVADMKALLDTLSTVQAEVMAAVAELLSRVEALHMGHKDLVRALGAPVEPQEEA